ncbi:MAG: alpha/beta hydrolase [Bacteroidales bacterium]|nr:alpha/beta hydrolase [Bacteroidales bacterium]
MKDSESYDGIHPKINAYSKMERVLNAAVAKQFGKNLYSIDQAEADAKVVKADAERKASGQFMNADEAYAFMAKMRRGPVQITPTVENIYTGAAPGSEKWSQPEVTVEYMSPFWNEINTCVYNVSTPSIEIYLPNERNRTGAAVIVCPGGGFEALSYSNEGPAVAKWLAEHGIAAFALKYRTPYFGNNVEDVTKIGLQNYGGQPRTDEIKELVAKAKEVAAEQGYDRAMSYDDGRKAIEYVRANAERFGINPEKVGIIGFSAGGAIALDVANNHTDASRPDFIGLMYGAMYSEVKVPADPMPMFMAATAFELARQNAELYNMWLMSRKPTEAHSFANARHGFGYRGNNAPEDLWIQIFYNFLKNIGIIENK